LLHIAGVRHGGNVGGVNGLHLLDKGEQSVEVGLGLGGLTVLEPDSGQMGDALDVVQGQTHDYSGSRYQ
jgi:hypothetical protein